MTALTDDSNFITDDHLRKIYGNSHCGVYAIGPQEGTPLKIGITKNIANRVSSIQTGHWLKIKCHVIAWTSSTDKAVFLEEKCHALLDKAQKRISGEWFTIDPEWAAKVIAHVADSLNIRTLSHNEMLKKFQKSEANRLDYFWQ